MVNWAVRSCEDSVLEPCFGSGVFLQALKETQENCSVEVYGVEMMEPTYSSAIQSGLLHPDRALLSDFLDVAPFQVNAIVGNPPYVRLRSIPPAQEQKARKTAQEVLGVSIDAASSLWLVFLLHSIRFLAKGGRLAFVLPYEITHVRYAKPLWKFLGKNFGHLRVLRVKERIFPDLMQEVVILLADGVGDSTDDVIFEAYDNLRHLVVGKPEIKRTFPIETIIHDRPFVRALLSKELDALLQDRIAPLTVPVPEFCTFNIGYVSGHKRFFHPDLDTINTYQLPHTSLRNTVVASRELRAVGLHTSSIDPARLRQLFYPNSSLASSEKEYILQGERDRVDLGYKCRNRTPWYKVTDVRVPDLLLSVFREVPLLLANDAGLVASNSVLCGFMRQTCPTAQFISAWYTSLTLLYCELQVHSLGGGIPILIPGEIAKVRIPSPVSLPTTHLNELDRALLADDDFYKVGDTRILNKALGFTTKEIELIEEGVKSLSGWRKAYQSRSRKGILSKHVEEDVTLFESLNDSLNKGSNREFMLSGAEEVVT